MIRSLSAADIALILGVSRSHAYALIRTMPHEALSPQCLRVREDDFNAWRWAMPPRRCCNGCMGISTRSTSASSSSVSLGAKNGTLGSGHTRKAKKPSDYVPRDGIEPPTRGFSILGTVFFQGLCRKKCGVLFAMRPARRRGAVQKRHNRVRP